MAITSHVFSTSEALADAVARKLSEHVSTKPDAVLGLATGGTPTIVYEALARDYRSTDFSRVTFFALDEYIGLPPDHPCSYHHYLWHRVLKPLGADPARVFIPDGMDDDRQRAAARYEASLEASGGVDLWLAGIGHNGHLAFNEPGSAFDSRTRDVDLNPVTRQANARFFDDPADVPTCAITAGLGTLKAHAREILLLVRGLDKAAILDRALNGPVTEEVPASMLQTMRVSGYFDQAAMPRD